MNPSASTTHDQEPTPGADQLAAPSPAEIDASARYPVLLFLLKGAGWLAIGLLLLVIASIKFHGPGFLSGSAWLGLGRIKPAALNCLVYGFAAQFGFALMLWQLCRLGRTRLLNAPFLFLAGVVWNFGVFLGVIGILGGASTGHLFLEMPRVAWPFLGVAVVLISVWGLLTFHNRKQHGLYVSQWFLMAGLFWLPWILTAGCYLLVFDPLRGVVQSTVSAWYAHNFLFMWMTPIGLATIYYFVPKRTGQPLPSREMTALGFWFLLLAGPWGGMTRLAGGPIPNWMISTSVAANVLLLVTVVTVVINIWANMEGKCALWKDKSNANAGFRLILLGTAAFVGAGLLNALISFRTVSEFTLFTHIPVALDHLMLLGFFGLVGLGAAYEIVPKITGSQWPCDKLTRWHYLGTVYGLSLHVVALLLAGLIQGMKMNNPEVEFMSAVKSTIPFIGLSTIGLLVAFLAQVAFLWNLEKIVFAHVKTLIMPVMAWMGCGSTGNAEGKS
jgi:cytochrome c oxidase cbb3-type subunit 1